jgi:hypothetical protein
MAPTNPVCAGPKVERGNQGWVTEEGKGTKEGNEKLELKRKTKFG